MRSNPMISVIIPVYNIEQYIEVSIMSVLNQTYSNLEIIVVNDGSTDSSASIIKTLVTLDNRIKFIDNKKNMGIAHTRNIGLGTATGDYIGFVDGDDTIMPTMYEKLLNSILETNSDISFCDILCLPSKRALIGTLSNEYGDVVDLTDCKDELIEKLLFLTPSPCNKLYSKKIFDEIRYPSGKLFEDLVVYSQLVLKAKKLSFVRERLYAYLTGRKGSIMSTKDDNYFVQRIEQWADKYNELKSLNRPSISKKCYLKLYKEFWIVRKKIRKQFSDIKQILKSDRPKYNFGIIEKIWMITQKRPVLRRVFSKIEKPLKKVIKS